MKQNSHLFSSQLSHYPNHMFLNLHHDSLHYGHFKGSFMGVMYESAELPTRAFNNHYSCKQFLHVKKVVFKKC